MAALTTALLALTAAASVGSAVSTMTQKKPKNPALPVLPAPPDPIAAQRDQEAAIARMRAKPLVGGTTAGRAGTLLTGPSGQSAPASVQQKTLLGL